MIAGDERKAAILKAVVDGISSGLSTSMEKGELEVRLYRKRRNLIKNGLALKVTDIFIEKVRERLGL